MSDLKKEEREKNTKMSLLTQPNSSPLIGVAKVHANNRRSLFNELLFWPHQSRKVVLGAAGNLTENRVRCVCVPLCV